jgi:Ca-activated chloride channel family protein
MRAKTVGLLSAIGMLASSVGVYALVPAPRAVSSSSAAAAASASASADEAPVPAARARFERTSGSLRLEGRLAKAGVELGESTDQMLLLEVSPADEKVAAERAPVSLSIVVDRSGSMKGKRLANALRAATMAVARLRDGDTVSVVAFDGFVQTVVKPTVVGPSTRERIQRGIDGITVGGDTCISCALREALALLGGTRGDGKVRSVLLLSDGEPTQGSKKEDDFRAIGFSALAVEVGMSSIGVDSQYDDKLLVALANASNGRHYFVPEDGGLVKAFEEEAQRLASSVAAGVEAEIELPAGVELGKVFDRPFRREGNKIVVPLGSFGAGDRKSALLSLRVSPRDKGVFATAKVTLRFEDLVAKRAASCAGDLEALAGLATTELDPEVLVRVRRSETAAALREANRFFDEGKLAEARASLRKAKSKAEAAKSGGGALSGRGKADLGAQVHSLEDAEKGFAGDAGPPSPSPMNPATPKPIRKPSDPFDAPMQRRQNSSVINRMEL